MTLSGFQIKALLAGVLLTVAGLIGWVWTTSIQPRNTVWPVHTTTESNRSMVDSSNGSQTPVVTEGSKSPTEWVSSKGFQLGLSFLIAFAIGYIFRIFLRTMAILTVGSVIGVVLLSYFNLYNIDLTQVEHQWDTHREWVTTQVGKLKDRVWEYLPSTSAGFVGFFVGMLLR
ncbi:MAG: hypothetical protein KatS3mg104_2013 [Phycisphaerae bacterium]|jgi:uncharacterized membrane protein (Fun14 family)|nr:MAG: hypothetical protein KatS3mg104_2013 [Phycisphaerae bacterium]